VAAEQAHAALKQSRIGLTSNGFISKAELAAEKALLLLLRGVVQRRAGLLAEAHKDLESAVRLGGALDKLNLWEAWLELARLWRQVRENAYPWATDFDLPHCPSLATIRSSNGGCGGSVATGRARRSTTARASA